MVDSDGVILRVWRRVNALADQMIGARLSEVILSDWAQAQLHDAMTLTLREGAERIMTVYVRTPQGAILHRRLIIHPLNETELIITAHPVTRDPPRTRK